VGSTQRYELFGEPRTPVLTSTDRLYTGQVYDRDVQLMDYGARYYDAKLGRFVQADTIVPEPGNPQALNRFSYVANNPLRYTDPTGHRVACGAVNESCGEPPPPPPPVPAYDPAESARQAWGLVRDWFFERGPEVQYFGPESSLTQDIMYDPGMNRFRESWATAGHPLPWKWEHTADEREGGLLPVRMIKGAGVYIREHAVELGLSTVGLGSKTPEGRIDPVGGTIGSLDEIYAYIGGSPSLTLLGHRLSSCILSVAA
jgi:RHS repeat-associated protein